MLTNQLPVKILSIGTYRTEQTENVVKLLIEQFDQNLHYLPFPLHLWMQYSIVSTNCFIFRTVMEIISGVQIFWNFYDVRIMVFLLPQYIERNMTLFVTLPP